MDGKGRRARNGGNKGEGSTESEGKGAQFNRRELSARGRNYA